MKFKFAAAGAQPADVGVPVSLAACHAAWQRARRGKKPSANQLAFEARWLDRLQTLCTTLREGRWQPARTVSFVVKHPKTREIHAPGCGLPVGNLSSQFFANVYLNALDQFVKHTLKVRHYLRYVDDFVLLASSREQLLQWQRQIEVFLREELRLKYKDGAVLQPCTQGVDFLGYRVYAHHRLVRPRVVRHCCARLGQWQQRHSRPERVRPADFAQLQALLGSYWGHFAHADSVSLRRSLFARMPWLQVFSPCRLMPA